MKNSLRSKVTIAFNCFFWLLVGWAIVLTLSCLILLFTGCDPHGEIVPKGSRNTQEKRLERLLPQAPTFPDSNTSGKDSHDED